MAQIVRTVAGAAAASTITAPMTTGSPASGGGTFSVTNGSGYPTADFVVVIDRGLATEEKILCSARSANVITVGTAGRGFDGTAAAAHSNGATLEHELDAAVITALLEHVNTNAGDDHQGYLPAATAAGAGLSVAARVLAVNVDASGIEINADTLRLKDGGVTSAKIADGTIATGDLADDAVTNPKLANMANGTVKGRFTAGTSDPEDVTMTELKAMLALAFSGLTDYASLPHGLMGYALKTADQTGISTEADISGLSVTFTAVTGRLYRITEFHNNISSTVGGTDTFEIRIKIGATQLQRNSNFVANTGSEGGPTIFIGALTAGSTTVKVTMLRTIGTGTGTYGAAATAPASLVVEDIGPA